MITITIESSDLATARYIAYFIVHSRILDEKKYYQPRSLIRRIKDAFKPDQPWWKYGGGNQWNNMPGISFEYKVVPQ